MTFEESVTQFIQEHRLIHRRMRLVAGVSGGADSMALLCFLLSKKKEWALELAVCSVDHQLRGAQGRADLDFVSSFCAQKGVVFFGKTVDAGALAKRKKESVELAARELRYGAFRRAVAQFAADALVLAHHGDDQVETMLMHQVRGSFGMARAGIPVCRPFTAGCSLIRPFLTQTKSRLEAYCRQKGIEPRVDPSNQSPRHTRNRFRKQVLPFLKQENPNVHLKFQYASERLAEDESFLLSLAQSKISSVVTSSEKGRVTFSIDALLATPVPLQRRIIHLILNYLYQEHNMKPLHQSIHIEILLHLLQSGDASGTLSFPGALFVRKSYRTCRIGFSPPKNSAKAYERMLAVSGETVTPAGIFETRFVDEPQESGSPSNILLLHREQAVFPLMVRTWRPGDRMAPSGMDGFQKVQRIFINKKIDREKRLIWPLIADADGRILWLPLLRRAHLRKQTPERMEKSPALQIIFHPLPILGGFRHE